MKLTEIKRGKLFEITSFIGNREMVAKMNAIGLYTNQIIKLLRTGPFGGPLLIEETTSGGRLMIADKFARSVEVREIEDVETR